MALSSVEVIETMPVGRSSRTAVQMIRVLDIFSTDFRKDWNYSLSRSSGINPGLRADGPRRELRGLLTVSLRSSHLQQTRSLAIDGACD